MSRPLFFSAVAAVCFLVSSCHETFRGEGPVTVQSRDVESINRLAINMTVTVLVTDTTVSFCRVHAQENVQEAIMTKADGATLYISSKGTLITTEPVVVEVGMVRPQGFEVNGSGEVKGVNTLKNDKISFEVNGSGKMQADVVALKTRSYVSGSGNVTLTGSTQEHRVEISGSGEVHAYGLSSLETSADLSGSGNAWVSVTDKLRVQISGSGEIHYKGSPDVKERVTGSGKVVAER